MYDSSRSFCSVILCGGHFQVAIFFLVWSIFLTTKGGGSYIFCLFWSDGICTCRHTNIGDWWTKPQEIGMCRDEGDLKSLGHGCSIIIQISSRSRSALSHPQWNQYHEVFQQKIDSPIFSYLFHITPHLQHLPISWKMEDKNSPYQRLVELVVLFLVQQKPFSPTKHLKVYNSLPMGVALYPLTFKNTFVEEKSSMTFAFRTTPLSGIRWTILHLPQDSMDEYSVGW